LSSVLPPGWGWTVGVVWEAELVVLGELLAFVPPSLLELLPTVALLAGDAPELEESLVSVFAG
jgi:hypothetical protein